MANLLNVSPEAEADLAQAYEWYERQKAGLGREFFDHVGVVMQRIQDSPELHAETYKNVRLALVKRFPYVVCFTLEDRRVDVVGVFHGHRDPNTWQSQLPQ